MACGSWTLGFGVDVRVQDRSAATTPPSTRMSVPVMNDAAGLHRNAMTWAISSGVTGTTERTELHEVAGAAVGGHLGEAHRGGDDAGGQRHTAGATRSPLECLAAGESLHTDLGERVRHAGVVAEPEDGVVERVVEHGEARRRVRGRSPGTRPSRRCTRRPCRRRPGGRTRRAPGPCRRGRCRARCGRRPVPATRRR